MDATQPQRIVLWGTYDRATPRLRILRAGLLAHGVEVIECHYDLWSGVGDKSQIKGLSRWLHLLARALLAYPVLAWRYLRLPRHDVALVCYPGMIDLFVLRPLAWVRRTPLGWDWFLCAYDTIVLDRRLLSPANPLARVIKAVEWVATRLPDFLFMDTAAHARRMEHMFSLPDSRVDHVWVGAQDEFFQPAQSAQPPSSRPLVLFYGKFIPLHGLPTIIDAARLLQDEPIDWLIVGRGQQAPLIDQTLARYRLENVVRMSWANPPQLRALLARATIVLGIFGSSDKAASVIPNKVFQALATNSALITRDGPAIRELLPHSTQAAQLIEPGNARALADAIQSSLALRPSPTMPASRFDAHAIGASLLGVVSRCLEKRIRP